MSAVEFREHAAEHLDWAKTAKSDRERQTLQQMAEAWLEARVRGPRLRRLSSAVSVFPWWPTLICSSQSQYSPANPTIADATFIPQGQDALLK
jgi:hypothetical protein